MRDIDPKTKGMRDIRANGQIESRRCEWEDWKNMMRKGLRMWGVLPGLVERSKHVMEGMIEEAGYPTLWPGDPPGGFIASDVPTVAVMLRKLADVESKASTL